VDEQSFQNEPLKLKVLQQKSFDWLLLRLLPPTDKICGCALQMPETAIFENGKVKIVLKTDKDGCVSVLK